jgi:hypothetical protein
MSVRLLRIPFHPEAYHEEEAGKESHQLLRGIDGKLREVINREERLEALQEASQEIAVRDHGVACSSEFGGAHRQRPVGGDGFVEPIVTPQDLVDGHRRRQEAAVMLNVELGDRARLVHGLSHGIGPKASPKAGLPRTGCRGKSASPCASDAAEKLEQEKPRRSGAL